MAYGLFATTSTAALISITFAGVALADVTADDVWQNWQDLGKASNLTISTTKSERIGDTLVLTDVTLTMASPEINIDSVMGEVRLQETADGRVTITQPASYSMQVNMQPSGAEAIAFALDVNQDGLIYTASGDPDALNYDISAADVSVKMSGFQVDGAAKDLAVDFSITDLVATYLLQKSDLLNITSTYYGDTLRFALSGTDDLNGTKFKMSGQNQGIAAASESSMLNSVVNIDLPTMLLNGFSATTAFTYNSGAMKIETVDENNSTMDIDTTSEGGKFNMAIDRNRIAYGLAANGVTLKASGSAIPLPEITAAYDEAALDLLVPLAKSGAPQDFTFSTRLTGLTVSDFLWSMIDPGATLPRDPATLIVETKGKASPLVDLLNEAQLEEALIAGAPLQINGLEITALQLTVGGAELKGDGALTFDNTQPPVLGGVAPMPVGKVNLTLDGANGLLGKLQALGLVEPQMVMGFGLFSGMLAKPGPTPDSLITEIELQPGGEILANGNPLPF
jgi:hypothetical protein